MAFKNNPSILISTAVVTVLLAVSGCTTAAVTAAHNNNPGAQNVELVCNEYGADIYEVRSDVEEMYKDGWRIAMAAKETSYAFGIWNSMVVCFEREKHGGSPEETTTEQRKEFRTRAPDA